MRVEAGGQAREVEVPHITDSHTENAVAHARVSFPAVTGNQLRVTVLQSRKVMTLDWYSASPVALPIGVAEPGAVGVRATPPPDTVPDACHTDLLTVDGRPGFDKIAGVAENQERRYYAITVKPQVFINLVPDHVILHRMFPLAADRTRFEQLFESRRVAYRHAHLRLDASAAPVDALVEQLLDHLDD